MDTTRDADIAAILPSWRDFTAAALPGSGYGTHRLRFETGPGLDAYSLVLAAFPDEEADIADGCARIKVETKANLENGSVEIWVREDQTDTILVDELFAAARERLTALGRKRIYADLASPPLTAAYANLYTQAAAFTAIGSGLDLAAVDRDQYAQWAEPSEKNQDYRIVHWVDRCPDDFAESYCTCLSALNDAPEEELEIEHLKPDVTRLRQGEALTASYGARRYVTVAVSAQGEVAGFTQTIWFPEEPANIDLWSTAVARDHRGRGLGLRIKAAATLELLQGNPQAAWILTYNNHGNDHMLAVNRQLGYKRLRTWEVHKFAC